MFGSSALKVTRVDAPAGRYTVALAYPAAVRDVDLTYRPRFADGGQVRFRVGAKTVTVKRKSSLYFTVNAPAGTPVTVAPLAARDRHNNGNGAGVQFSLSEALRNTAEPRRTPPAVRATRGRLVDGAAERAAHRAPDHAVGADLEAERVAAGAHAHVHHARTSGALPRRQDLQLAAVALPDRHLLAAHREADALELAAVGGDAADGLAAQAAAVEHGARRCSWRWPYGGRGPRRRAGSAARGGGQAQAALDPDAGLAHERPLPVGVQAPAAKVSLKASVAAPGERGGGMPVPIFSQLSGEKKAVSAIIWRPASRPVPCG